MALGLQTVLTPNAGGGTFTVLTPAVASKIKDSIFLNQTNALNNPQIVSQQNRIQSNLQRDLNKVGVEQFTQTDLKRGAESALKFTDDAIGRINLIRTRIDSAIKIALQADEGDATSFASLATTFDTFVNQIIDTAETGPSPNLLSELPQSSFKFATNTGGSTFTINPVFLGSGYTITEDVSGDQFVRINSTKTIEEVSGTTGSFTGVSAPIFGGVRLDSFDSATNAIGITLAPSTAGATSITGTLSKSGIGVGNAFIYDNLESQTGRDRAIADLQAAKVILDQQIIKFNAAQAQAQLVFNKAETQLSDLLDKTDVLTAVAELKVQAVAAQAEKLNELNVNRLQAQTAFRKELTNLIPVNGRIGSFTSALIDVFI